MNNSAVTAGLTFGVLLAMILLGGGVLVWLSPVPADLLTPAQTNLIYLSDTMVKGAIGAIIGFAGARWIGRANGVVASQQ